MASLPGPSASATPPVPAAWPSLSGIVTATGSIQPAATDGRCSAGLEQSRVYRLECELRPPPDIARNEKSSEIRVICRRLSIFLYAQCRAVNCRVDISQRRDGCRRRRECYRDAGRKRRGHRANHLIPEPVTGAGALRADAKIRLQRKLGRCRNDDLSIEPVDTAQASASRPSPKIRSMRKQDKQTRAVVRRSIRFPQPSGRLVLPATGAPESVITATT